MEAAAAASSPSPLKRFQCLAAKSSPPSAKDWQAAESYPISKPKLWPEVFDAGKGDETTVCFAHTNRDLFARFFCAGAFREPVSEASKESLAFADDKGVPASVTSVLDDDRVEIFIGLAGEAAGEPDYYAIEVNRSGKALTNAARWGKRFDFNSWGAKPNQSWGKLVDCRETEGGVEVVLVVKKWPWKSSETSEATRPILIGAFRAQQRQGDGGEHDFSWTSAVDPLDDLVDFHRVELFGELALLD